MAEEGKTVRQSVGVETDAEVAAAGGNLARLEWIAALASPDT